jgi:hypothetical protein
VSIPRYLNLGLTNLNPEQWFLGEIGDGPVLMETQKITTEPASRGR